MSLTKEKIARWIEEEIANDYFRFDLICSSVTVHNFIQIDNSLEVYYSFWDDGHSDSSDQNSFLFDLGFGEEDGVNFPKKFDHVFCKVYYQWPSLNDCEKLNSNLIDIQEQITDVKSYKWGDAEIEQFIDINLSEIDRKSMAKMHIEKYGARESLPGFIPACLAHHFQKIISEQSIKPLNRNK